MSQNTKNAIHQEEEEEEEEDNDELEIYSKKCKGKKNIKNKNKNIKLIKAKANKGKSISEKKKRNKRFTNKKENEEENDDDNDDDSGYELNCEEQKDDQKNKPEIFYKKIENEGKIIYELQENKVVDYIQKYSKHNKFIILIFIGKSRCGKSQLSENMTGIKHEIGSGSASVTNGATIAYGGTIYDIYERMKIEPLEYENQDIDVFIIDTEGICNDLNKNYIAPFIIPLLVFSSKIVTFLSPQPDDSISNFLSISKSYIILNDNVEIDDPFTDRLIVRIIDFPQTIVNNVDYYSNLFETKSIVAKNFNKQSIHPIYAPGGPYDSIYEIHDKKYTEYFLDKIFLPFINQEDAPKQKVYSDAAKFINDVKNAINPQTENQIISKLFKEKSTGEIILESVCSEINENIEIFFHNNIDKMEFNEETSDDFFKKNVEEKLRNACEQHKIEEFYFYKFLELEKINFNEKKKELNIRIDKYQMLKSLIISAKSEKDRILNILKYLSEKVTDDANHVAKEIVNNSGFHFFKNGRSNDIEKLISKHKKEDIQYLKDAKIPFLFINNQITIDITNVFDKLNQMKKYPFYHRNYFFSLIFDFNEEKEEIYNGIWGVVDKDAKKYCNIIVDPRKYDEKFSEIIIFNIEDDLFTSCSEIMDESNIEMDSIQYDKIDDHGINDNNNHIKKSDEQTNKQNCNINDNDNSSDLNNNNNNNNNNDDDDDTDQCCNKKKDVNYQIGIMKKSKEYDKITTANRQKGKIKSDKITQNKKCLTVNTKEQNETEKDEKDELSININQNVDKLERKGKSLHRRKRRKIKGNNGSKRNNNKIDNNDIIRNHNDNDINHESDNKNTNHRIYNTTNESIYNTSNESTYNTSNDSKYNTSNESTYNTSNESTYNTSNESTYNTSNKSIYNTSNKSIYNSSNESTYNTSNESTYNTSNDNIYNTSNDSIYNTSNDSIYNSSNKSIYNTSNDSIYNTSNDSIYNTSNDSIYNSSNKSIYNTSNDSIYNTSNENIYNTSNDNDNNYHDINNDSKNDSDIKNTNDSIFNDIKENNDDNDEDDDNDNSFHGIKNDDNEYKQCKEKKREKNKKKPVIFYEKTKYEFQEKDVFDYIQTNSKHDEFIILVFIGNSQFGKSQLSQNMTGIKHEIGSGIESKTKGATIAYAGTIEDIYKRMKIEPLKYKNQDLDVFIIDTEGICGKSNQKTIAKLITPLLVFSSKIITFLLYTPDDSINNFLLICRSFIILSDDGQNEDPFKDKLIVRIKDFPLNDIKDVDYHVNDFEKQSRIAKNFKKSSFHPIYTPGGPFNQKKYDPIFTKYFLDKVFESFLNPKTKLNQIVYSKPDKFIENIIKITNNSSKNINMINKKYHDDNISQRILGYKCDNINKKIDKFFYEKLDALDYDDKQINQFFKDNIELALKNTCTKHKIEENYFIDYLKKEEKYFESKKQHLKRQIDYYKKFRMDLKKVKSEREKTLVRLAEISMFVTDSAQNAADNIFWYTENCFKKIETYEHMIITDINNYMNSCIQFLKRKDMKVPPEFNRGIQSDISKLFNKLLTFKKFTFYREHGPISKILHFMFDTVVEKKTLDKLSDGLWGVVNEKTNKYCKIIVDYRNYESKFIDIVEGLFDDGFLSNFQSSQIENIKKLMEEQNISHLIDLKNDQIDKVAKEIIKSSSKT